MLEKYQDYAQQLLRLGISLVFLWFGLNLVFDASGWISYLPGFALALPIAEVSVVRVIGVFLTLASLALGAGALTQIAALLLSLFTLATIILFSYSGISIMLFGLLVALFVALINGVDNWTFDAWLDDYRNTEKKKQEEARLEDE